MRIQPPLHRSTVNKMSLMNVQTLELVSPIHHPWNMSMIMCILYPDSCNIFLVCTLCPCVVELKTITGWPVQLSPAKVTRCRCIQPPWSHWRDQVFPNKVWGACTLVVVYHDCMHGWFPRYSCSQPSLNHKNALWFARLPFNGNFQGVELFHGIIHKFCVNSYVGKTSKIDVSLCTCIRAQYHTPYNFPFMTLSQRIKPKKNSPPPHKKNNFSR